MSSKTAFNRTLAGSLVVSSIILSLAKFQSRAPYGKFGGLKKASVDLDPRFGWWLMELPATVSFLLNFYWGLNASKDKEDGASKPSGWMQKLLFVLWVRHYFNRGWFFPLTIRVATGAKQSFALNNALVGMLFLTAHGYLNARQFTQFGSHLNDEWFADPRFKLGMILYELGFWITVHSEHVVKNLRPLVPVPGDARYKIPMGGMFHYVTNAAYFGELLAWTGMCTLTWSPTLLPVLFISLGNLVPRAFEQHKWYLKKFPDYPKDRKVLIPFVI
ncbi:hypothetical protein BASA81_000327 [Batrachochytrium salamandrivorans]|nr:hypothetical protein BASA81_000327 [Batrachochytrium salamandrivorans]